MHEEWCTLLDRKKDSPSDGKLCAGWADYKKLIEETLRDGFPSNTDAAGFLRSVFSRIFLQAGKQEKSERKKGSPGSSCLETSLLAA